MSNQDNEMSIHIDEHDMFEGDIEQQPTEPEPIKQVRVIYDVNGKPKPYFDPKFTYIFYTWLDIPAHLLSHTPIIVKKLTHHSFNQMMDEIKRDIQDKEPKMLTIASFDKMIPHMTNSAVMAGIKQLFKMVNDGGIHYISAGSQLFIPSQSENWYRKAQINSDLRALNIENNVPPLGLHKCLMTPLYETYGPLTVQGKMWTEFASGTGLGSSLSLLGYKKLAHFIHLSSGLQFEDIPRQSSHKYIGLPTPPRLCQTQDYLNSEAMCQILRDRGLFNVGPNSTNSLQEASVAQPEAQQPDIEPPPPPPQGAQGSEEELPPQGAQGSDADLQPLVRSSHPPSESDSDTSSSMEEDDDSDSRPLEDSNYNEGDNSSIRDRINRRFHLNESVDEIKARMRKMTLDNIKEKAQHKREVRALKNDLENQQATEDNLQKKLAKYKEEIKKLKSEKERFVLDRETMLMERACQDNEVKKVQKQLQDAKDKLEWMEGNYDFLKKIHTEKTQLIEAEWITVVESMKKAGINLSEHMRVDNAEAVEYLTPEVHSDRKKKD